MREKAVSRFRQGVVGAQGGNRPKRERELDGAELGEPSAMTLFDIRLNRGTEATRFSFAPLGHT